MAGFNPYAGSFYMQDLQNIRDRIDRQMQQYQQNQQFMQPQQAPITQNFQIAPNQPQTELQCAYVNGIDEVKNTFVMKNGIFVNKELTNMWFKDVTGDVKTFELKEVIELDEKDRALMEKDNVINDLQKQLNELKGVILYANKQQPSPITEGDDGITAKEPKRVSRNKSNDEK